MIKILHTADLQINIRDKNLSSGYEKTLLEIENIIRNKQIDIYLFCGDIFEHFPVNDIERKMFYKHLGAVLNIPTLKEMVIINGNHDLPRNKKIIDLERENNPLDTFVNTSQYLTEELAKKVTYLKLQQEYVSRVNPNLVWVSYSLEDGSSNGSNLKFNPELQNKYRIPIYHDILEEYIIDKGLPVSQNKRQYLASMDTFDLSPNYKSLVLMGDIHENWSFFKDNKQAIYPGSPVQRNYGEGSYLKIAKNPTYKQADQKVVKYIELNLDDNNISNTTYVVEDILLKNNLNYITISFNTKFFIEDWQVQLNNLLNSVEFSENINNIKVEFSSFYMKHEIEILNTINTKLNTLNSINFIEPIYGTILFNEENQIDLYEEGEESNNEIDLDIDDISLDTEKLSLIFSKIIENNAIKIKKDFVNPAEYEEIITEIQTLFDEQINLVYGAKTTYNIEMEDVYTNGFMALGENKILLDIVGLTRIVANNGIGKTTLFNMLRFITKGNVLEGLPKNKSKENLLLIFNDTMHDLDALTNQLNLKINNLPFQIERTARRTWKAGTTVEQKKSKNWRKYIDNVTTNLKLIKFKDEGNTVLMNDEAQSYIDTFFGNTPETILILNQFKILSILNSTGDKLKELILDYIGIDYLKSLDINLEMVKINYSVTKPEKAQLDLIVEKNQINKTLQDNEKTSETIAISKKEDEESLNKAKQNIVNIDNKLVQFGDVPKNIENTKADVSKLQTELDSFEVKSIQELPVFNLIKPAEKDLSIENSTIKTLQTRSGELSKENTDNLIAFNKLRLEKITKIEEQVEKLEEENKTFLKEKALEFINKNESNIKQINVIKKEHINKLDEFRKSTVELAEVLKSKVQENLDSTNLKVQALQTDINNLTSKINNAFCFSCNKPLELTAEQIEAFKVTKTEKSKELVLLKETIENYKKEIQQYDKEINDNNNGFAVLKSQINWDSTQNALIVLENELKKLEEINCSKYSLLEPLYKDCINNHVASLDLIKSEEVLKKNNMIIQFNDVKNKFVIPLSNLTNDLQPFRAIKFIEDLVLILDSYNKNRELISQIDIDIKTNKDIIDTAQKEYNDLTKTYQEEYQKFLDETNKINGENKLVNEHNANQGKLIAQLDISKNNLKIYENNLSDYLKYTEEKTNENLNIERLNTQLNSYEISINNITNYNSNAQKDLDLILIEEEKWKQYKFKNYIYKTFEKFIKEDFKYAIFNYYRQFLNAKLNILLEGLDFRLYWNEDSNLYLVSLDKDIDGNSEMTYRPVKLASGMQTTFLSLALIYAIHIMNTKNNISHMFIDEISGQLNDGKNVNSEEVEGEIIDKTNYQDKLVRLLAKFDKKKIFIVDHVVSSLFETHTYYVVKKRVNDKIVSVYK